MLNGISFSLQNGYAIALIDDLTDEIKSAIKKQLSFICYGKSASESNYSIYSYKNTLDEFLKRYENKSEKIYNGTVI